MSLQLHYSAEEKCYDIGSKTDRRGKNRKGMMAEMTARTRARILLGIVALLAITLLVPVVVWADAQAIVWTDKQDYPPGDTVIIHGFCFLANTPVNVSVTRPDLTVGSWNLTSDNAGNLTTSYQLDGVTGIYTVTATDGTNTATTAFTDAEPAFMTVSYSVVGGGSGYSAPVFHYVDPYGNYIEYLLTTTATEIQVGPGSSWSVTPNPLTGSGMSERWYSNQVLIGNTGIGSNQTMVFTYHHQYYITVTSAYGSPTQSSQWVNAGNGFTVSVTTPDVVVANQQQRVLTDLSVDGQAQTLSNTVTFTGVQAAHTIVFSWTEQYYVTAKYSTSDGSTPSATVILSGTQSGFDFALALTTSSRYTWLDAGTVWSVNNPIPASPTTERWIATSGTSGTVTGALTVAPLYYHQLKTTLSYIVVGGGVPIAPTFTAKQFGVSYGQVLTNTPADYWFDAGSSWTLTNPLEGSTSSERWVTVGPVSGTIFSAMTISPTYCHQFYLDVSGRDVGSGWYESGSTARVTTSGIYSRNSGMGFRIVSYSIDGGAPVNVAPTTGNIDVLVLMGAPHKLAFNSVTQYEVGLDAGAVESLNYITAPTVSGDNYWYDSRTSVDVMLNGVWNRASGTGKRLVSYAVKGKGENPIASIGKVIALSLASITSPQYIAAKITTQFMLNTPSGSLASITPTPISGDTGWYDLGTTVAAVYNYVWNVTADQSRTNAVGFDIDGGTKVTLPRAGDGRFTVNVTMDTPHTINIASVMQYLVYFRFTDNSGSRQIIPTSFEIDVQGVGVEEVQGSRIWLDSGISFTIYREIWGNMDVKPQDQVVYRVDRPLNETIRSRIFDGELKVTDMLGLPTPGAQVIVTLANGTQIRGTTDADGHFIVPMIPLGRYNATISNLGTSTQIDGDASKQSVAEAKVILSYPTIIAIAIIAVVAVIVYKVQNPPRVRKLDQPIDKGHIPSALRIGRYYSFT
jgi:hypothetical protein